MAFFVIMCDAAFPSIGVAQSNRIPGLGPDTVVVVAGPAFAAGSFHRKLFGANYRDLWTMKIRVPVLDLKRFAGGLTPLKRGGGKQTKSLRLSTVDSVEYVFRPVYKAGTNLPAEFEGTLVWWIFRDAGSASHPGAAVAAVPMLDIAGVLHPSPHLVVMPDDPVLGEFRKEFAGELGTIEEYPTVPKEAPGFANAVEIMDARDLLEAMNKDPSSQVDARTMLKARLTDLLLGDNDRHPDQWKWARLTKKGLYEPIARDRDKVFVSYNGLVISVARKVLPSLVRFSGTYFDPPALFENATDFDRRVLGGLDRAVWEATARHLQQAFTDAVIDSTINAMPREYAAASPDVRATLRERRDHLPEAALTYYRELFREADVHGTDAADRATVTRRADGSVDLSIAVGNDSPWFQRHYDPADTREIRLYLHDGDDEALITGTVDHSIKVRIVGGNGKNTFTDRSQVRDDPDATRLYDEGNVKDVKYARDTVDEQKDEATALNHYFNRRPWVNGFGHLVPPQKDYGTSVTPLVGTQTGHGLGLIPRIGIARYVYGFREVPYSSLIQGDVALASSTRGVRLRLFGDKRYESTDIHLPAAASLSQLEVVQFRGFGNQVAENDSAFFDVRQTQWQFRPAVGISFAPGSDISLGPIVRYVATDSARNRFISTSRPYGFRRFGEAGMQLALRFDTRPAPDSSKPRVVVDVTGSGYPGMWGARTAYEALEGQVLGFMTLRMPKKPVIALRAGGKKLYGNFPYFDAAFLGGGSSFRTEHRQRYAGDASLFGSVELRVPLAKVPFILPLDIGALGFTDAGRVYVNGDSPGGWHTATGVGFWVGAVNAGTNVNVLLTNRSNRRVLVSLGFAY